jgi:hypothetical protein
MESWRSPLVSEYTAIQPSRSTSTDALYRRYLNGIECAPVTTSEKADSKESAFCVAYNIEKQGSLRNLTSVPRAAHAAYWVDYY